MKSAIAITLGYVVFIMGASAQPSEERIERRIVIERDGGPEAPNRIDANADGWITRAEASAEAERMFAELDANDDNRLDSADHGGDHLVRFEIPLAGEERIERHITVIRHDGPTPPDAPAELDLPEPPIPPEPPHPPMFVMMLANTEEADSNNDGALSREEFTAQQLRFFDAGDGNRDGRIRFEPIEPPAPPAPPRPPIR